MTQHLGGLRIWAEVGPDRDKADAQEMHKRAGESTEQSVCTFPMDLQPSPAKDREVIWLPLLHLAESLQGSLGVKAVPQLCAAPHCMDL